MTEKQKIGEVFTYFAKIGVAGIKLTDSSLAVGNRILIKGHTTNFEQKVTSMQVGKNNIDDAVVGQEIGIRVDERVRPHDIVYKLIG